MFESIFGAVSSTTATMSTRNIAYILIATIITGLVISFTYVKSERKSEGTKSFSVSLIFLPAIIASIIFVIGTNIASAFSLGGAFSLIRFRSNPGSPKDIVYVFLAMASGLATGMGYIAFAVSFAVILCAILFIINVFVLHASKTGNYKLKIYIPENLNFKGVFDKTLKKYTTNYTLLKVATSDLGTVYVLSYSLSMKDNINEKNMIDELRTLNGNLNIILSVSADEGAGFSMNS